MTATYDFDTKTGAYGAGAVRAAGAEPASFDATLKASMTNARLPWPAVVYLFCIIVPISFPAGSLAMTTLRLFLMIMVVPVMIQILTGRHGKLIAADILFPLHILWAAVALYVNNPDRMVQQVGSVGIEFIGGYAIARAYIRTPQDFFALCRVFAILLIGLLPLSIFEALTGRMPPLEWIHNMPFINSIRRATGDMRLGMSRVQSIFNHPIHFGLFCSIALSFCFVGMRGFVSTSRRYVNAIATSLNGFLALSSGAILAMLLQMGLIAWDLTLRRVRARWWILVSLFALAYIVIDILSNRSPIQVFMSYATFSAGTAYWRSLIFTYGMENVWANPIYGLGLNDWARPDWMHTSSVDNFWLLMAMRYGIPGFLLLAVGYVLSLIRMMRRDFSTDPLLQQFRKAWLFSFLGLSFTLATVHVWNNAYSMVFFMFGAGMWMLTTEPRAWDRTAPQDAQSDAAPDVADGPASTGPASPYTRFPAATGDVIKTRAEAEARTGTDTPLVRTSQGAPITSRPDLATNDLAPARSDRPQATFARDVADSSDTRAASERSRGPAPQFGRPR